MLLSCLAAQRYSAALAPGLEVIVSGRAQRVQSLRSRLSVALCAGCSPATLVKIEAPHVGNQCLGPIWAFSLAASRCV